VGAEPRRGFATIPDAESEPAPWPPSYSRPLR
jgi:hypothetical protein